MSLTTGVYNTANGIYPLLSLTDGNFCTGVGAGTLLANTADENTATGAGALLSNLVGTGNPADGAFALFKTLIARIEEQDARIQRVSNQIQISSSTAQVAVSNQ